MSTNNLTGSAIYKGLWPL